MDDFSRGPLYIVKASAKTGLAPGLTEKHASELVEYTWYIFGVDSYVCPLIELSMVKVMIRTLVEKGLTRPIVTFWFKTSLLNLLFSYTRGMEYKFRAEIHQTLLPQFSFVA